MGLSGVKKRSKLSHDPNNTAWSKSTTTFGHKILSKQGWKPGEYLGAENASHSDHFTAANASHIRVLLREDNLGLGAQVGKGNAETFGLSMFSGLLGRLNGKSDGEVQKQQDAIRDVELKTYTGQKYGFMNFVSGGFLLGDKMEPRKDDPNTAGECIPKGDGSSSNRKRKSAGDDHEGGNRERSKKKLKSENTVQGGSDLSVDDSPKKTRKSKSREERIQNSDSPSRAEMATKSKKNQKEKKGRDAETTTAPPALSNENEKMRSKEEKRARKEERRKRKEEKQKRRATKEAALQDESKPSAVTTDSEATTPVSTLPTYGGRQAVRQRYIQQKRMVLMDPKALSEIFMMQAKTAT